MAVGKALVLALVLVRCFACLSLIAQEPPITALAFSPDGEYLVTGSQRGVQVLRWPELSLLKTFDSSPSNRYSLAFSPSGEQIAVAGGYPAQRGILQVFSWPDGEQLVEWEGHEDTVQSIVWVNEQQLLSGAMDRVIRRWDVEKPEEVLFELQGHSRSVDGLCLLGDGQTLVSTGEDQSLRVWDLESTALIRSLNQHTKPVNAVALQPATGGLPMVASAAQDRTLRFWQPTIGRMVRYIRLESEPLAIAWLDGGEQIAAGCTDGQVRIVDAYELEVTSTLPAIHGWAYCLAVHPKEKTIVAGGSEGQLCKLTIGEVR